MTNQRRVGNLVVTAISDGTFPLPLDALLGIDPADASAMLVAHGRPPSPVVPVLAYLVQGRGRTVLIDTGGGGMAPTLGRLQTNLAAAGVTPEAVDLVLLTHLHSDHSGGLTHPDGQAVFPNAELALAAAEAAFWLDEAAAAAAPEARRPSFAAARLAVAPYRERIRLLNVEKAAPGVSLVALPGHTPGHSGYRVTDGADTLLIWGDVMHVPAVQSARPGVSLIYDSDPAQAEATRRRLLDMATADGLVVAGMHMDAPVFARVTRDGTGYTLTAA